MTTTKDPLVLQMLQDIGYTLRRKDHNLGLRIICFSSPKDREDLNAMDSCSCLVLVVDSYNQFSPGLVNEWYRTNVPTLVRASPNLSILLIIVGRTNKYHSGSIRKLLPGVNKGIIVSQLTDPSIVDMINTSLSVNSKPRKHS
jgi:hypothetical protein